jgi:hypothetical protein
MSGEGHVYLMALWVWECRRQRLSAADHQIVRSCVLKARVGLSLSATEEEVVRRNWTVETCAGSWKVGVGADGRLCTLGSR